MDHYGTLRGTPGVRYSDQERRGQGGGDPGWGGNGNGGGWWVMGTGRVWVHLALFGLLLYCTALHKVRFLPLFQEPCQPWPNDPSKPLFCTVLHCTILYCTVLYCTDPAALLVLSTRKVRNVSY